MHSWIMPMAFSLFYFCLALWNKCKFYTVVCPPFFPSVIFPLYLFFSPHSYQRATGGNGWYWCVTAAALCKMFLIFSLSTDLHWKMYSLVKLTIAYFVMIKLCSRYLPILLTDWLYVYEKYCRLHSINNAMQKHS